MKIVMQTIRFGIVGYGKVAGLHVQALAGLDACELAAVCGRDQAKAEAFAAPHGIAAFTSIAKMVSQQELDAVIIATPHLQHREHSISALEAGAHVLVEKPMALSVEACDAMISAAHTHGRLLGVISQRRWFPAVRRVREAIDAGKIGVPVLGQVIMLGWRDEAYYRSDPWRGSWSGEGGGVLANQAPHQLDLMQWFMGPIEEVFAYWDNLNHPYIEVEDTAVAIFRCQNGALGNILVSNSQKPGIYAKVHVHGRSGASVGVQTDGGAMFVAGMSGIVEPAWNDIWTIPGEERLPLQWRNEDEVLFSRIDPTSYFHALQFADFADSIRNGRAPAVDGREGRKSVALIEAIYRSGREHIPVKLPDEMASSG
jgi:UDP-N-acetyl-2-amino-2-deoxyglucuronate dehydrogenase